MVDYIPWMILGATVSSFCTGFAFFIQEWKVRQAKKGESFLTEADLKEISIQKVKILENLNDIDNPRLTKALLLKENFLKAAPYLSMAKLEDIVISMGETESEETL